MCVAFLLRTCFEHSNTRDFPVSLLKRSSRDQPMLRYLHPLMCTIGFIGVFVGLSSLPCVGKFAMPIILASALFELLLQEGIW
jgi:hypothetical protein